MEIVEIARQHNLIIFADEIYDKILYDDAEHHSIAPLAPDLLTITFNGLSKTYRVAGFRQGWSFTQETPGISLINSHARLRCS